MAYNYRNWKTRMSDRQDLSSSLVHLTRAATIDGERLSSVDVLLKILRERVIVGSTTDSGFIRGDRSAVCFQDAPLYSVAQNLKYEKELVQAGSTRNRYSGCGLVFSKYYLFERGCRPVIYDKLNEGSEYLNERELYRLVKLDLSNIDNIIDWSHEREWRLPGNLEFAVDATGIVLETKQDFSEFIVKCQLPENESILNQTCGIIVLDALLM